MAAQASQGTRLTPLDIPEAWVYPVDRDERLERNEGFIDELFIWV